MATIADQWKRDGRLAGGGVVATVMSNLGLERYLGARGLSLVRTQVGDRYVLERMRADGFNLGGEQSGHIIMTDHATTGDGLMAALQALAALIKSGKPASETFRAFEPVPQLLKNVRVGDANAALNAAAVVKAIAAAEKAAGQGRAHPGAQVGHRAADPRHGRGRRFGPRAQRRRPDHRGDPRQAA